MLDPVAVALKFGFLAVLYLFLLWTVRSALRDLRRTSARRARCAATTTRPGLHHGERVRAGGRDPEAARRDGRRAEVRRGLRPAARARCSGAATRPTSCSRTPSPPSRHARLVPHGDVIVLEDLGSTNGTYLNDEPLRGPQPLHPGDRVRIGDSVFTFERWHPCCASPSTSTTPTWAASARATRTTSSSARPLFVVADGMGGAQAGEVASELAVQQFEGGLPDGRDPAAALVELIQAANARIHEEARADAQRAGMGTTLTAAYLARRRRRRRARRRLPLLPAPRRRPDPPHPRPLARRRARRPRQAHRGAGRVAPAALRDHPRARRRRGRRGRRRGLPGPRRRPVPGLLRRPDRAWSTSRSSSRCCSRRARSSRSAAR